MRLRIALATLAWIALVPAQQQPTIRVPVRLVTLPTLVFSQENRLLAGLQSTDFQVLDNGRVEAVTVDPQPRPVSVAIAIQVNRDVREYTSFLAKVGSAVDTLLVGETGEAAVISYADEVTVVKDFDRPGDVQRALRTLSAGGRSARMADAGSRAVTLLAARPRSRDRVLLFIGQPLDSGSETSLDSLREAAGKENVAVYALALPMLGQSFVSDTFSLRGPTFVERGGFRADLDLGKLVSTLNKGSHAETHADQFSILVAATGGTQLHFRTQHQFEDGVAELGIELRSAYLLSYYPGSSEVGYHSVKVTVSVPGAKVFSRPGYWLAE